MQKAVAGERTCTSLWSMTSSSARSSLSSSASLSASLRPLFADTCCAGAWRPVRSSRATSDGLPRAAQPPHRGTRLDHCTDNRVWSGPVIMSISVPSDKVENDRHIHPHQHSLCCTATEIERCEPKTTLRMR